MKFIQYLNEKDKKSTIKPFLKSLWDMGFNKAKTLLKSSYKELLKVINDNNLEDDFLKIINKHLKSNYKSMNQLSKLHEETLNEDFKNFWEMFKSEGWPAISIFPALSLWFEFDKLLDGAGLSDLNYKKVSVYGIIWLFLVLGKHIAGWKKWKQENPVEFEEEGSKKNPFAR